MTHPDGSPYSAAERAAIIKEARATARELLGLLELLAAPGGDDEIAMASGERKPANGHDAGGIPRLG